MLAYIVVLDPNANPPGVPAGERPDNTLPPGFAGPGGSRPDNSLPESPGGGGERPPHVWGQPGVRPPDASTKPPGEENKPGYVFVFIPGQGSKWVSIEDLKEALEGADTKPVEPEEPPIMEPK